MSIPDKVEAVLGDITDATRRKLDEVWDAAVAAGHTPSWAWGWGPRPEHASRRALDLMVYRVDGTPGIDAAAGDFIRDYLWEHRARLGVRHVLWEQHITSTVVRPGVRRAMPDRGNATANHDDHVHVLFVDDRYHPPGAAARVARPAPAPKRPAHAHARTVRLLYWDRRRMLSGVDVRRLQSELRRVFPAYAGHLARDGVFGPATHRAVREFQRRAGLVIDGIVGPKTRTALRRHGVRL